MKFCPFARLKRNWYIAALAAEFSFFYNERIWFDEDGLQNNNNNSNQPQTQTHSITIRFYSEDVKNLRKKNKKHVMH